MNINESYYQNSLAKHRIDFFSNYFKILNQKYNQIEGIDFRITKAVEIILKVLGLALDIASAPIRMPIKAFAMLYSKHFTPEQIEGFVR